jgi:hypothetical protein
MKTSKYLSAAFLILVGSMLTIHAQDTILNRSVSVEREYRPVIHDAGKINSMPQVLEPNVVKSEATYSNFNLPLIAGYNIHTLPAADLEMNKPVLSNGYARLGIGNFLNTLADFAYPLVNTPESKLDFSLNHLGTFEDKKMHTVTRGNLSFDQLFKKFDLYAAIGGGHEFFKYYGNYYNGANSIIDVHDLSTNYLNPDYSEINRIGIDITPRTYSLDSLANYPNSETFWRFNALAGVRSLPLSTDLRYQAEINYKVFNSHNGLTENLVHSSAGFNSISGKNRMGLDLELYNMTYSSVVIPDFNFWNTYSVLVLNPYYSIERPAYNVRLGLKTNLSFVHGKFISPTADLLGEWKAIPKYLSVYGGLSGNYEVNTLDKVFTENPYLFSDLRLLDTYTPVDFFAGIKLKPLYNLLLDAYIDYKQIDNQYFFVNKGYSLIMSTIPVPTENGSIFSNRFNVVYSGATVVKMGIRANYNLQNKVNVEFKWAYNGWNVDTEAIAWNKPKYEAQLNSDVRISDNFTVSANVFYEGVRYAKIGSYAIPMNDKVDINLGANYSYNKWLNVFLKVNNLINTKYQDYYGYDVQGTNLMVGAAFSF